jgi:serine/threonine-protein kinase
LASAEPERAKRLGDLLAGDRLNQEDIPLFRTRAASPASGPEPLPFEVLLPPVGELTEGTLVLSRRIRAATGIGFFLLLCLLVKNLLEDHYATAPRWLLSSHLVSVSVLGLTFFWLAIRPPRAEPQLRRLEWVVLAGFVLFLAAYHLYLFSLCRPLLLSVAPRSPVEDEFVDTVNEAATFRWFMVIAGYGIFIPNRPWRFWAVSVGLALLPLGLTATFGLDAAPRNYVLASLIEMALWLTGAVAISFAGTRMIARYRRQVEEARRVGAYTVERHLKSGGMGHVFRATHSQMLQPCAIKFLTSAVPERFHDEAARMARLCHPHIVQIHNCGEQGGTPYLVMELLRGRTLQELVDLAGPLPGERVIHLLLQVCSALTYLHGFGFVHHDIKPSNLFVCEEYGGEADWVKLLDFGLTRPPTAAKETVPARAGAFWGTPGYVPPDLMPPLFGPADARADIFSVGASAYFMLEGKSPFDRGTPLATLFAVRNDHPPPPRGRNNEPVADLAAVVLRCLEKDPTGRYASIPELAMALRSCRCAHGWDSALARQWWGQHPLVPESAE